MEISKNKVVTFHYTLTDEEGSFTETSEERDPVAYLHGRNNIVPGLEAELAGKRAGDEVKASVPPELAVDRVQKLSVAIYPQARQAHRQMGMLHQDHQQQQQLQQQ